MSRYVVLGLWVAAISACGPEPLDVSGPWAGNNTLIITGAETASGTEGISVRQTGTEIEFSFAGCDVKASQRDENTFDVYDFQCTRLVNQKTWTLYGDGTSRIDAGPNTFNMSVAGDAETGNERVRFSWSFTGTRR